MQKLMPLVATTKFVVVAGDFVFVAPLKPIPSGATMTLLVDVVVVGDEAVVVVGDDAVFLADEDVSVLVEDDAVVLAVPLDRILV